jgi:hypothetical protein
MGAQPSPFGFGDVVPHRGSTGMRGRAGSCPPALRPLRCGALLCSPFGHLKPVNQGPR